VSWRDGLARVSSGPDVQVHHDVARFAWHVVLADGSTLPEGLTLQSSMTAARSPGSSAFSDRWHVPIETNGNGGISFRCLA
jgi:hypothetical protein